MLFVFIYPSLPLQLRFSAFSLNRQRHTSILTPLRLAHLSLCLSHTMETGYTLPWLHGPPSPPNQAEGDEDRDQDQDHDHVGNPDIPCHLRTLAYQSTTLTTYRDPFP